MERQVVLTSPTGLVGADLTPAYRSHRLPGTSCHLSPAVSSHLCSNTCFHPSPVTCPHLRAVQGGATFPGLVPRFKKKEDIPAMTKSILKHKIQTLTGKNVKIIEEEMKYKPKVLPTSPSSTLLSSSSTLHPPLSSSSSSSPHP